MEQNNWADQRMDALSETEWKPNTSRGWALLQQRRRRPEFRVWWAAASATCAVLVMALVVPSSRAVAQRLWESVFLKRVEVVEVNPESIESLSPSVSMNSAGFQTAADVAEASRMAGFEPTLAVGFGTPKLMVTGPIQARLTLRKETLERDLRRAGVFDVTIPEQWDGVAVNASIQPIVIAEYNGFTLTQSPHISLNVPLAVSMEQLGMVVFRLLGHDKREAEELGAKFAAHPAWFLAIPREERARLKQVQLTSGPAMLIEDVNDKNGTERWTLLWTTQDRVLVLSGPDEAQLIRVAETVR